MSKTHKKEIMTDPILKKGHVHSEKSRAPAICRECSGTGFLWKGTDIENECPRCEGLGVVYD